jgi:hypothetical protein
VDSGVILPHFSVYIYINILRKVSNMHA